MRTIRTSLASYLALVILLCVASAAEPKTYGKDGLQFSYLANWTVTEDKESQFNRQLFLDGPEDALGVIDIYKAEDAPKLVWYAETYAKAMKEENSFLFERDAGVLGQVEKVGDDEIVVENFSAKFLYVLDLKFSTSFRRLRVSDKIVFVYLMVADEGRQAAYPGFETIYSSLRLTEKAQ